MRKLTVAERVEAIFRSVTQAVGLAAGVLCQRRVDPAYNRRRIAQMKRHLQEALQQIEELEKR